MNDYLTTAVNDDPEKVFLYQGKEQLTYKDFDEVTDKLAESFLQAGLKRGDHMGVLATNQMEWVITFFAATKIGLGVIALSPRYRDSELEYMLNHSQARAIVTIDELGGFDFAQYFQENQHVFPMLEKYIFIENGFPGSYSFSELTKQPLHNKALLDKAKQEVSAEDLAVMIYTSGTTGKPKGVMITHHSIISSAKAQVEHFQVTEDDVAVGSLPFNHVGGITCTVIVALLSQSSITLVPIFDPKHVLEVIDLYQATIIGAVPTMYMMMFAVESLTSYDLSSIRLAVAGGSNVEPKLVQKINKVLPNAQLVNLYGLSESSGACILSKLTDKTEKVERTIGVPIGDFKVKVVNKENQEVNRDELGELLVKGDCVAKGYYRDNEKTKATFTQDGWLHTGDAVSMEEDSYIVYRGRMNEMFIQGGFNIFPVEVENVLTSHPKVEHAAGIGIPDPFMGEVGRYYIITKDELITEAELFTYCKARMADYKVPRQLVFVDALPITPAGKIQKAKLKNDYLQSK